MHALDFEHCSLTKFIDYLVLDHFLGYSPGKTVEMYKGYQHALDFDHFLQCRLILFTLTLTYNLAYKIGNT